MLPAAAALAALIVEPIPAKSVATAAMKSGTAITNAMGHLPTCHDPMSQDDPGDARVTVDP
ncbi:hypothetical protein LAUMK4_04943 [Mycobacterium persicum]|uniref:Uncharacterized protein n=1 Tax=Mycobacterium persicum TaxID=1487726 RepID=A0AB38UZC5_9MYCO|nr:hypothetical protein LAUMK15_05243 [Mycobacterium persicum]VAZ86075.1 hypothetical protein LAUMK42_04918 [Mycobacterium persicum]VBA30060.1 hypothetical protein LAUMK4_04943 [Mycobacterium persicum]